MDKQATKEEKDWNKQLSNHLDRYTQIREWSDLANWLVKLKQLLTDIKGTHIYDRDILLTKLASCLNPSLPIALHELTIQSYDILMKLDIPSTPLSIDVIMNSALQSLSLLCVGLFPFFQAATTRTKLKILQLFTKHLVKLGTQCSPLITGLLVSILPGLLEMNDQLQKQIPATIDAYIELLGQQLVVTSIWTAMLRASNCRIPGFKYLTAKLIQQGFDTVQDDESEQDDDFWESTIKEKTNIKDSKSKAMQVTAELKDDTDNHEEPSEQGQDQHKTETVVESRPSMKAIKNVVNYMPFKDSLVVNTIVACLQDQNSLIVKASLDFLYRYLSLRSHENILTEKEKDVLVDSVILLLIKRDISTTRKINLWLFGKPDEDNKYNITDRNALVINLLISSFQRHFVSTKWTNSTVSMSSTSAPNSPTLPVNEQILVPLKMLLNFYSEHEHLIEKTLPNLSKELVSFIYNAQQQEVGSPTIKETKTPAIAPANSAVASAAVSSSNSTTPAKQTLKVAMRIMDHVGSQKIVILESLGRQLELACTQKDTSSATFTLILIDFFLEKLLKQEEIKEKKQLLVSTLNLVINTLQEKVLEKAYIKSALSLVGKVVTQYEQFHYDKKNPANVIPEQVTQAHEKFCAFYAYLCEFIKKDDTYGEEFETVNKLFIKLHKFRNKNHKVDIYSEVMLSTVRLSSLQYFLSTTEAITKIMEAASTAPIYEQFKQLLIEEGRNRGRRNSITTNCISLALQKLWLLLSYSQLHQKTIQLILKLSKQFPNLLTEVVSKSFQSSNHSEKQISIVKFSVFWKLTGRFKELLSSKELNELNKVGLFLMLDFLQHENPLVRHTTKLWIDESLGEFNRILDPLLEVLLMPASLWYKTYQGQFIYTRHFEHKRVIDIMKKLKVLFTQCKDKQLMKVLIKNLTQNIKGYYEHFIGQKKEATYLDLFMRLLMRYLQGRMPNEPSINVDLSACELLDCLILCIDDPKVCFNSIRLYIKEILMCLHFAILNQELVSQIQLLGLLKTILFESSLKRFSHAQVPDLKKFMSQILSSRMLISNLLLGLDNPTPYIKERYVQFITLSLPLFLEYHSNPVGIICHILSIYTTKITIINGQRTQNSSDGTYKDLSISRSNTQILILLNGINNIFANFLDIRMRPFDKEKTQSDSDSGLFSLNSWKSFVSLGYTNNFVSKLSSKKAEEVGKQLMNEMYQTILTMTDCWTISQLQPYYKLSRFGVEPFVSEKFHQFSNSLYTVLSQYETGESVEIYIINMLRVLYHNYPREILNCIVLNWTSTTCIQTRLKIIQILLVMSLPVQQFYEVLLDTSMGDKVKKMDRRRKNNVNLQKHPQNDLLLLCQVFSHYSYQSFNMVQVNHLTTLWTGFIKFAKLFIGSRNPITLFMLMELFDLFLKKNNPKELLKDQRIRKQLQLLANELQALVQLAAGKFKLTFPDSFRGSLDEMLPLPTSVYEVYLNEKMKVEEAKMSCLFFNMASLEKCQEYMRLYSFIILKRIGYEMVQNLYNDGDLVLCKKVRQYFAQLFPVIEDKTPANLTFAQRSSEMLCHILEKKLIYLKEFKNDILQIFNKDDFFICSRKTLQYWVKIIDMVIDSHNKEMDIFTEYLSKVSLANSIFVKESTETKKKIKSFERICFILYSGTRDKYNSKLPSLVEKIVDVIKTADAPQPVLILILFCIRILILRTSSEALTKLLTDLWQMILLLLMSIFNKQLDKKQSSMNLVWAALKLIQMISLTEMGEFYTHQWIFFYDFAGVQLVSSTSPGDTMFEYQIKPLVQRLLPGGTRAIMIEHTKSLQQPSQPKRHIIVKQDKIDDIELMRAKTLALAQYMIQNNCCKYRVALEEVEELIEGDFLTLDEFIYKVQ